MVLSAAMMLIVVPAMAGCKNVGDNPYYPPKPAPAVAPSHSSEPTAEKNNGADSRIGDATPTPASPLYQRAQQLATDLLARTQLTQQGTEYPRHLFSVGPTTTVTHSGHPGTDTTFQLPDDTVKGVRLQMVYVGEGTMTVQVGASGAVTVVPGRKITADTQPQPTVIPLADTDAGQVVRVSTGDGAVGAWMISVMCVDGTNPQCQ